MVPLWVGDPIRHRLGNTPPFQPRPENCSKFLLSPQFVPTTGNVRMNRLVRPETLFFLAVWLIALLAFRERGFYDPGSLWHVKVGEIILKDGMPHTDPFSYTFEG